MRALLLPVRGDWYGLDLERVRTVIEPRSVTRLPGGPPAVIGVINVRGTVVPVVDTAAALGLPPLGTGDVAAVAVAECDDGLIAFAGTGMPQADTLEDELGAAQLPLGGTRFRSEHGPVTLVDLEALVGAGVAA